MGIIPLAFCKQFISAIYTNNSYTTGTFWHEQCLDLKQDDAFAQCSAIIVVIIIINLSKTARDRVLLSVSERKLDQTWWWKTRRLQNHAESVKSTIDILMIQHQWTVALPYGTYWRLKLWRCSCSTACAHLCRKAKKGHSELTLEKMKRLGSVILFSFLLAKEGECLCVEFLFTHWTGDCFQMELIMAL